LHVQGWFKFSYKKHLLNLAIKFAKTLSKNVKLF